MKSILLLFVSLSFTIFALEGFFRWKEKKIDQQWFVFPPNQTFTFEPDSTILVGIKGKKTFHTNKQGYRSTKEFTTDTKNWLCVGGSTTECTYLGDKETWYGLLEKKLGPQFCFASIGKSGHTSKDHYYYLKNILTPDKNIKGVILMCGLNDLIKYLANPSFDLAIHEEDSLLHLEKAGRINENRFIAHSAFLYWIKEHFLKKCKVANEIDRKGSILKLWRANYQSRKTRLDTLPNLEKVISQYKQNIEKTILLCKEKNIKLILLSQEAIWKTSLTPYEENLVWMGGIGDYQNQKECTYYSPKALDEGLKLFNLTTKESCSKSNIKFIHLLLPKDTSVFYDDCHFNEQGAIKVANRLLYEFN